MIGNSVPRMDLAAIIRPGADLGITCKTPDATERQAAHTAAQRLQAQWLAAQSDIEAAIYQAKLEQLP